jgi:hypothetical protein
MQRSGSLRLELFDAYGDPLAERVDIFLHHQTLTETVPVRNIVAGKSILIRNLLGAPQGLYRLYIDPPSYLPVSIFVNIAAGPKPTERALPFIVDPEKVVDVDFPQWDEVRYAHALLEASTNVEGFANKSGEFLYGELDRVRKAGLLNILAKCRRTPFESGGVVLDFVKELRELRGDRFFAVVTKELRENVKNSTLSGLFSEASALLHRPPDGYSVAGSYKTPDRYGNLQLTFFASGDNWLADIDIDDASGIEHVFQVVRNSVTGRPTNPYYIHDILVRYQEIDPGYRFVFHTAATRKRAAAGQKL